MGRAESAGMRRNGGMGIDSDLRRFELWLLVVAFLVSMGLIAVLAVFLTVPISNYLQAPGLVQFDGEQTLVSEVEGVVTRVHKWSHDSVASGEPILKVETTEKRIGIKSLDLRIAYLKSQLNQLRKLELLGALDQDPVDSKLLQIQQAEQERQLLTKTTIDAPFGGYFFYLRPAKDLAGTYIRRGEIIGYMYRSRQMVVRVILPNHWIDRFSKISQAKVYYKDPASYLSKSLPASVESIHVQKEKDQIIVFCRFDSPADSSGVFQPGIKVKVSFLVDSSGILQEVLGVDLYTPIMRGLSAFKSSR